MSTSSTSGAAGALIGSRRAAAALGVDERTVVRLANAGVLRVATRTPGGHRRYSPADVAALARRRADNPTGGTPDAQPVRPNP